MAHIIEIYKISQSYFSDTKPEFMKDISPGIGEKSANYH